MQLFYATHDGQTRRIAEWIAKRLEERKQPVSINDLSVDFPDAPKIAAAQRVIFAAPVRYGHHLPVADRFLALYASLAKRPPLALASINLTARKPGRDTLEGNPYLRRWLEKRKVSPDLVGVFAGRLDYPSYGWLDRQMIRLIMKITKGPTDPSTQIEFTDWNQVDAFAQKIAERVNLDGK